jgi:hypothetical protein
MSNVKTLVNVGRYHLGDRLQYVIIPWAFLAFSFLVNLVIAAISPPIPDGFRTGGVVTIFCWVFIIGVISVARSLPFGFAIGLSRRSYYLGTLGLNAVLAAVYGLGLAGLQAIERGTGGWGLSMYFFRFWWLLEGSWYVTWLTSFVLFALMFIYGMWSGLIYRRWQLPGTIVFICAQALVGLALIVTTTWAHAWHQVGHFFTTVSPAGLTGLLAALAMVLGAGGFATMRRVTV